MRHAPKVIHPRATGRTTLTDVARAAGVSPITASRALRRDRNVAADLVDRVLLAASSLGYVPDPAAQALASRRSRNIVVLVPLLSNRVFADLVEALQTNLLQGGYQTLFGVTHYDLSEEERLLKSYMPLRPAGLVLTGCDHTNGSLELLRASRMPCVHVMETTAVHGGYSVGFSQLDAGRCITDHLVQTGRRRIAFAAAQLDPRVIQRATGYRSSLVEAGLYDASLEILDPRPSSIALGAEMLERLLQVRPAVDAVFFCNDDLAQGALLAAARCGLKVPQQLAVAGFNDLEGSDEMVPRLTSVRTPRAEIGRRAAHVMLAVLNGQPPATHCVDLGYELIRREST
jgi:LacI family transcriptional regulator, gluconate utilization system Gnt-I transcriptional repressor